MNGKGTTSAGKAGGPVVTVPPLLALALALVVVLVPIWSVAIPPLLDYPNHLARQYILAGLPDSAVLQQFYIAEWRPVPNLAMDAVVQALSGILAVDIAGKVFLSSALLLVALAPIALSRALFGHITPISLAGLLLVNSEVVGLGFVNFVFSAGLALCLLAAWIQFRKRPLWVAIAAFPLLSLALFFAHLTGYGVYVALVCTYELGLVLRGIRGRRRKGIGLLWRDSWPFYISLALQIAVPMAVFLLASPISAAPEPSVYGGIWRKIEMLGGLFFYLVQPHSWIVDRGLAIALTAAMVALTLLRAVAVSRVMALPLICMLLVFLLTPMSLFGGWGADHRLLLPLGLLLAGSCRMTKGTVRQWTAVGAAVVVAVVSRTAVVTGEWHRANRTYEEYQRAFESLEDGSKVYFAAGHTGGQRTWPAPAYFLPCLAVAKKDIYLPYLFANPSQQPLRYTSRYVGLQRISRGPVLTHGESPNWDTLRRSFDYFLLTNEQFFRDPVPKDMIPVFRGKQVAVYRNPDS